MVSPATGGGIGTAFHFGRRAAQIVADHLLHLGPPPEIALAKEIPRFWLQHATRLALDPQRPNAFLSSGAQYAPHVCVAQHVYFRKHGGKEAQLRRFPSPS